MAQSLLDSDSSFSRYKARTGTRISKPKDLKSYVAIQDSKKRAFRIIDGLYSGKIREESMVDLKDRVEKEIRKVFDNVSIDDEDLLQIINGAVSKIKVINL